MRYYKATMDNGYCGCKEVELFTEPNSVNVDNQYALDLLQNYSFYEPDSRFVDENDYESDEEYMEAYDEYQAYCTVDIEELSREEYKAECENYGYEFED